MQLFVGFQHCEFAMLRCISMGNSIKFGIDQSPFSIGLIGRFRRESHCMGSHCQCDPFSMPPHTMNVSISVEKSALTDFKWFYTIIWLFFRCVMLFLHLFSKHLNLVHCYWFFSPPVSLVLMFLQLKTSDFLEYCWSRECKNIEHDSEWWNEQVPAEN